MSPQTNNYAANKPSEQSILDTIAEKTSNIEFHNVNQVRQETTLRNMATLGRRESILRDSTITITHNHNGDKIIEDLEENWVEKGDNAPLIYWQDLEKLYVQFPDNVTKTTFLNTYTSNPSGIIKTNGASIDPINSATQQHLTRRPVKCEILNVNPRISAQKINSILNQIIYKGNNAITIREGKQHGPQKHRTIMFTVDAEGLRKILSDMDGAIQYNQPSLKIRARLNIKVNCKPWQCKKCFRFGKHECTGDICGTCGMKGHVAKDCHSKKRHCSNCNKPGHRAKDSHCSSYQNEVIKEMRKVDIPLEYLTVKEKRVRLFNIIQTV